MAHKIKVGGTNYDIKGGKCKVGGTNYSIKRGKTLVGGTGYEITFTQLVTIKITGDGGDTAYVKIGSATYTSAATVQVEAGTRISIWASTAAEGYFVIRVSQSKNAIYGKQLAQESADGDATMNITDTAYGTPQNDVTINLLVEEESGENRRYAYYTYVNIYDPSVQDKFGLTTNNWW